MKIMKLVIATIVSIIIIAILSSSVYAGTVSSVNTAENQGKITVSGTAETGVLAVAVTVYSGDNLVYMETTNVNSDGTYNVELGKTFDDGIYTVKVADYNGGDYTTKENVIVGNPSDDENEIGKINITLKAPIIGESVTTTTVDHDGYGEFVQDNKPDVTVEEGANYEITDVMWITGTYPEVGDGFEEPISTTFEKDKYYYASISVSAKDGYKLANDVEIKVNGEDPAEVFAVFDNGSSTFFIAKIKATEKTEETAEENKSEETKTLDNKETSPQTGDIIRNVFLILGVAIVVFAVTLKFKENKNYRKH